MNERIKELAREAGFYITIDGSGILIPDPHTEDITEVAEKFAELIVRECEKALWSEECHTSDLALEQFNEQCIMIKQHFGVEK